MIRSMLWVVSSSGDITKNTMIVLAHGERLYTVLLGTYLGVNLLPWRRTMANFSRHVGLTFMGALTRLLSNTKCKGGEDKKQA